MRYILIGEQIDAGGLQERFGEGEFKEDIELKKLEPEDQAIDQETEAMMSPILNKEKNANQEKAKQDRKDKQEQEAIRIQELVNKL